MAPTLEITKEMIRSAAKNIGSEGKEFAYPLLYEVCGVSESSDVVKASVRTRINEMVRAKELTRIRDGVFTYNSKYRLRGESPFRQRVWRFIRSQKPGWTFKDASLLTGVSYTHILRYCTWLEQEGYIAHAGKQGLVNTYMATDLADKTPEMPQPPTKDHQPFERECRAAGKIVNLMLYGNPYQPKTAQEIVEAAKVLLARFEPATSAQ